MVRLAMVAVIILDILGKNPDNTVISYQLSVISYQLSVISFSGCVPLVQVGSF